MTQQTNFWQFGPKNQEANAIKKVPAKGYLGILLKKSYLKNCFDLFRANKCTDLPVLASGVLKMLQNICFKQDRGIL